MNIDQTIDRLQAMAGYANEAETNRHIAFAFSPRDAEALRTALDCVRAFEIGLRRGWTFGRWNFIKFGVTNFRGDWPSSLHGWAGTKAKTPWQAFLDAEAWLAGKEKENK